ncbi:MAG: FAD-dependent oxidoreductase [Gemmatimonadales bacterium]|jgi:thioredoxin reductase (NADPH)|nr:MAG: FAD-dependent oxidoreductase [Gemmatimonadales bacterium]
MDKPTLLAVDDDIDVLQAVARDLRGRYGRDHRIVRATSGQEALEILEELSKRGAPVALILSDQRMPGMDGVSFLSRTKDTCPRAKRVLLTAYADTDAAIAAINRSQVHYYLTKPWDPPEERLFPVLDDMLEDWRAGYRPGYGGVRVVGDRWSARCHLIRDFLARNQVPYQFLDVETSDEARALLGQGEPPRLPLVLLPGREQLQDPEVAEIADHIGLDTTVSEDFYDLAIVGGGPGGLAAAVYGGSEGLSTILIEREAPGGQAGTSSRIENYLGFPSGLSGADLARRAVAQARRFGVEILTPLEATNLRVDGPYKHLTLSDGSQVACHLVMLAMGVSWKLLPAEGAERLTGSGVYYGAAMTEALHVRGKTVYMVGAGNSAGQAAMFFKDYADKVVLLVRGGSLEAKMSQYLVSRIEATDNIEVQVGTEVVACRGDAHLEELDLRSAVDGSVTSVPAEYLFAFLGAAPHTEWLDGLVACDDRGFILTGGDLDPDVHLRDWPLERSPYMLETSVPGVFACGDARHDSVKRVASAVGEGSVSVSFMHQILAEL